MFKQYRQAAFLFLAGLFACSAPIETRASDDCFESTALPTPSCSTSYVSYVYISWSALTGDCSSRVRNYVVYRSTSSTFSWSGVTKLGTTTNKYYYDYSATAGTTYYYWIGVTDSSTGSIWVNYK